ncbi:hypothetical protein CYMTET_16231 [Cymbomonas tetramitiformis]|uniref:HAT C-terminal dimerisation domain-containing protein n=1 Tax=Cymbomonas tetramitiformis TaxID=36881 RepID=A0AAE0GCZ3_9CHLO|nr:hypothetical protein CYMTET_16231 [Cymbomonas tetramitiformis]
MMMIFNDLLDCKLEDFAVATLLDPRYKSFRFKYADRWMRGRFTRQQGGNGDFFLADDSDDEEILPTCAQESEKEEDELAQYLALPDAKKDVDLREWLSRKSKFPHLSRMARQFLAAPASTAGVERAFSAVTSMHSDLKKQREEGTIEHTLMAAMN